MNMHHKIEIDTALLTRYLAGEATPDEAMAIDDWLIVQKNRETFEQMQKTWQLFPGSVVHEAPQLTVVWSALETILPAAPARGRMKWLYRRYMLIAAVLTGVLLSAGIYWLLQPDTPERQVWLPACGYTGDNPWKGALPDGSDIVVNINSILQYPEDYNKTQRHVRLDGECYFNVLPDENKPFIVQIHELKILVLGTSFNVNRNDYSETVEVQVTTGKVKMYTDEKELIVTAGQTGVYFAEMGTFKIQDTVNTNALSYITGDLSFHDMPLPEICGYLENTYGVKIVITNDQLLQCRMSAHFKNRSITYIMDIIAATLDIRYTMRYKTIKIEGDGCN